MSTTILGNNSTPQYIYTTYEVEVDDDEYETMQGEYYDEESTLGYRATVPKNSASTTVQLVYYYKAATSSYMLDYYWGEAFPPLVPLVFACNSSGAITELLNNSVSQVTVANKSTGWITMNITLKRKLVKNEKIFFGIYGDIYSYVMSSLTGVSNACFFNYSNARRNHFASPVAYVSSSQYIANNHYINGECEACIYLQYENAVESVSYTRSISESVGAASSSSRKSVLKRTLTPYGNVTEQLSRKSNWKRLCLGSGSVASAAQRFNYMHRNNTDAQGFSDDVNKSIQIYRNIENLSEFVSQNTRLCAKRISASESFSFTDGVGKLLLIIRNCFSVSGNTESLSKVLDYKRMPESLVDDQEIITRCGDNFRSFTEDVELGALAFASRLFFRTVQTVLGLWDWLRGKIREANNIVCFFCPIDLEIELECKL